MRKISFFTVLLVAIGLFLGVAPQSPVSAQTQSEPTGFTNVTLWINPEYDDPRLLVMLEGQISGATAPATIRFLVPSAAEMYSAGSIDAHGQYSGGPPDRKPSSIPGWDEISYEPKTTTFRVEYYDPIIIGQPDKTIAYEFRWLYPISDLQVIIQEPRTATNFKITPGGQSFVDSEGFTCYEYNYSGLDQQPPLQFSINYTKTDARPSLAIDSNGGANGSSNTLAIVIAVIMGVVILGIVVWIRRSRPQARPARSIPRQGAGNRSGSRFCTQCGKPVETASRFCPHCGAKLRE